VSTSAVFWAVLVPSIALYWLLPRVRTWLISVVSAVYLAVLDPLSVAMVLAWSGVFYVASQKYGVRGKSRWIAFALIGLVLACLAYFKYVPAIVFLATGGEHGTSVAHVVVPLGVSYFTFKLIGYMLDSARGTMPAHSFRRFVEYMLMFTIFSAGPIERFEPFLKNEPQAFDKRLFGEGLTRIIYGLVKKLVVVDLLLTRTDSYRYNFVWWTPPTLKDALHDGASSLRAWQFVFNQNLYGYLDFSAYSDIAIGASLLFGYRIAENFDYPFLAVNIGEFWKRWHISLSSFCQRYVYMPVVGKTRSPYASIIATMLAIGLWHSGSLNLLVWSGFHAFLMCAFLTWGRIKRRRGWRFDSRAANVLGCLLTVSLVVASSSFTSTNKLGVRAGFKLFFKLFGIA
jgi:alginate O-acetyltransferase complex protein AlgI